MGCVRRWWETNHLAAYAINGDGLCVICSGLPRGHEVHRVAIAVLFHGDTNMYRDGLQSGFASPLRQEYLLEGKQSMTRHQLCPMR